jgi:hypothetical protein
MQVEGNVASVNGVTAPAEQDHSGPWVDGNRLLVVAVLIAIALAAWQYLSDPSLWVDEMAITRNVVDRSLGALLRRPLDFDQVAPPGFLAVEKLAVAMFGPTEWALRAYSLIMTIAGLVVMARLGRTYLGPTLAFLPVLLLGLSARTIWWAGQAKQYGGDLAISAGVTLLAVLVPRARSNRARVALALSGAAAPWFSYPGVFVLAAAGAVVFGDSFRARGRERTRLLAIVAAWATSAIASVLTARAGVAPDTVAFLRNAWRASFPTIPPTSMADLRWPFYMLRVEFDSLVNAPIGRVCFFVALLGAVQLWRRDRRTATLLLGPLALALLAAALRQYPFGERLSFFLAPQMALLLAAGIAATVRMTVGLEHQRRAIMAASLAVLPSLGWLAIHRPPYHVHDVRPVLAAVAQRARAGDVFYVPYSSWHVWMRYAPPAGLAGFPHLLGTCHGTQLDVYGGELDLLRGHSRVWIVFVPAGRLNDPAIILHHADQIGHALYHVQRENHDVRLVEGSVGAWLYDLTDGSGADSIRARPVSELRVPPQAERGCNGASVPPTAYQLK